MDLLSLLVTVLIFALIWWLINTYLPLPAPVKQIFTVVFVIVIIFSLLSFVGIGGSLLAWHPILR